jgi:hypothetical protein
MRGNLGMLDNINRLLDRVAAYLGDDTPPESKKSRFDNDPLAGAHCC